MKASRTKKSIINTGVSLGSQIVIILLGFISRRVLIYSVGVEYLGINGLMTNILSIFSLAESGIGVAIGYSLYKPLSENNIELIKSLMRFYRNVYRILAIMTAGIGMIFYPFLPFFLKNNTASNANLIYILFLASSVCSYLWSYKVTLNSSDQNKYLYTIANTLTQIAVLIAKVFILYFTQNYIIYLCIELGSTLIKNIIFSFIMDKRYPYLKEKNVNKLKKEERKKLFSNIKSLFLGKVGFILSQCSDNLVISSIISVASVGLYSNYTTLISSVSGFVTTFSSSVTASMGNLVASENKEKIYEVYKRIDFINYWLYSFSAICLLCLTEPFIILWLGKEYVLSKGILVVAILIFYLQGINSALDVVKNAAGLYYPDRFVPIIQALINLIISIVLAYKIGILGVLIGTLASFLSCSFWTKPFFVYKEIFDISFMKYIVGEGKKIIIATIIGGVIYFSQGLIQISNIYVNFCVKAVVTIIMSNGMLALMYKNTKEFYYIKQMIFGLTKHKYFSFKRN